MLPVIRYPIAAGAWGFVNRPVFLIGHLPTLPVLHRWTVQVEPLELLLWLNLLSLLTRELTVLVLLDILRQVFRHIWRDKCRSCVVKLGPATSLVCDSRMSLYTSSWHLCHGVRTACNTSQYKIPIFVCCWFANVPRSHDLREFSSSSHPSTLLLPVGFHKTMEGLILNGRSTFRKEPVTALTSKQKNLLTHVFARKTPKCHEAYSTYMVLGKKHKKCMYLSI